MAASDLLSALAMSTWAENRTLVLERDKRTCRDCGKPPRPGEAHVHHLVPRAAGGDDSLSNLVSLCISCHAARHPNLQMSLARRAVLRSSIAIARLLGDSTEVPRQLAALPSAMRLFGLHRLRPGQLDVIIAALQGKSVLSIRPTGWGKSVCFQLPALVSPGTALVLSPLKALMRDQVAGLQGQVIPATFLNGDLGPEERLSRLELLEAGVIKLVYCAPEKFGDSARPQDKDRLERLPVSFMVVDEAHCVDRWGRDFRPEYGRLAELRHRIGDPPVLAFTATAGPAARARILGSLGITEGGAVVLVGEVDRPNVALCRFSPSGARAAAIGTLLGGVQAGRTMIFVPTVREGEELQAELKVLGFDLPFYHAKAATPDWRDRTLGRWAGRTEPRLDGVICTSAFGMGIDVKDVRLVVHAQHPGSVEDYLQEIGRAGRDGEPALAVLISQDQRRESGLLLWMAERTFESATTRKVEGARASWEERKKGILRMSGLAHGSLECFRQALLSELAGDSLKRSLSRRVLEWPIVERPAISTAPFCCDVCEQNRRARRKRPALVPRTLSGHLPLWQVNAGVRFKYRDGARNPAVN